MDTRSCIKKPLSNPQKPIYLHPILSLDLDEVWNKELMPQLGRHPKAYHEYMLRRLQEIDEAAKGNRDIFMKEFTELKDYIIKHPEKLRKSGWE